MNVITFATMKGGTGKTTLSFNIACALAMEYKVLVIDFDSQCNLSANFNYDIFNENEITVANMLENPKTDPLDVLVPSPIEQLPNLDLMPSTMYLSGTEMTISTKTSREQIMASYMKRHPQFFDYYDYVIFDTGPNMGVINQNAFFVSDHILLVTDPNCNSAKGAHVFCRLWEDAREVSMKENNIDGLIVNNVERILITKDLFEFIENNEFLSKIKLETSIPHTTRFKECDNQNMPIQFLTTRTKQQEESRAKAEEAINQLVIELFERGIL